MMSTLLMAVLCTNGFPSELASATGGPAPSCSVCHVGATRRGTVTSPFGRAMLGKGLMAYDAASLRSALRALGLADSDGDGASDSDELKAGNDPNLSSRSTLQVPMPQYGCSAGGASVLAGLAWARARRRLIRGSKEGPSAASVRPE